MAAGSRVLAVWWRSARVALRRGWSRRHGGAERSDACTAVIHSQRPRIGETRWRGLPGPDLGLTFPRCRPQHGGRPRWRRFSAERRWLGCRLRLAHGATELTARSPRRTRRLGRPARCDVRVHECRWDVCFARGAVEDGASKRTCSSSADSVGSARRPGRRRWIRESLAKMCP
jgi:hypothetical protein